VGLGSLSHPPEAASLTAAAIKDLECEDLLEEYILEMNSQNLPIQEKMIQDAFGCGGKKSSQGGYEILIAVGVVFLNRGTVAGLRETRCLEIIESKFYGKQRDAYKLRSLMGEETKTQRIDLEGTGHLKSSGGECSGQRNRDGVGLGKCFLLILSACLWLRFPEI
jgi:hypothetical protein